MNLNPILKYDEITSKAQEICKMPISIITFAEENRVWFKSAQGLEIKEVPIEVCICNYVVSSCQSFVVTDTLKDSRFINNPLVYNPPNIRFYAGVPLLTPNNIAIGAIGVVDQIPREITNNQLSSLWGLGEEVMNFLDKMV